MLDYGTFSCTLEIQQNMIDGNNKLYFGHLCLILGFIQQRIKIDNCIFTATPLSYNHAWLYDYLIYDCWVFY